jgi:hypothetical protein
MVLVVSGCGGSSASAAGAKSKPTPGLPANSATADRALFTAKNCRELIDLPETFSDGLTGVNDGLAETHAVLKEFAAKSLLDFRPDFLLLGAAVATIEATLKTVNINSPTLSAAGIAKLRALSSEVNSTSVTDVSSYIADWAQKNCRSTA